MSPSERRIEALLLHDGFVRALARSLLADPHAADDVAQEAWLVALEGGGRAESASRWLAGVVRNLAGRLRRGEERRRRREHARARPEGTPAEAEILEREAARARVVQAVLALEEPYREGVLLRYFEGLPPRAIAQRLALPVETVRTRLKRALLVLRARLEQEFGGGELLGVALLPLARGPFGPLAVLSTMAVMSTQAKLAGAAAGIALIALFLLVRRPAPASARAEPPRTGTVALQAPPPEPDEERGAGARPAEPAPRAPLPAAESRAEAVHASEGSVRVRVSWFDGTPAEAIHVLVEPCWTREGPTLRTRAGLTDAEGMALVERVATGTALVSLDRGEVATGNVVAGDETEVALVVPRGFDVRGVVVDPGGAPVAGADVWATRRTLEQGHVLARTDGAGRFHLRSLVLGHVGARAAGFAPSLVQSVSAGEGSELELVLVLMGPGGALEGAVLDPAGNPVAGAWVAAGLDHPLGRVCMLPVGGRSEVAGVLSGPIEGRTDERGRYRIEGLAPGRRRIAVRALGFGAWRGTVEVVEDATRAQDVRLAPGVTLVGRVVHADGTPASASVEVGEPFSIFYSQADTDRDGRFRLEDMEVGELTVRADGGQAGRARTTLAGASGETLTWEARLALGGSIRGRVLDETGAPLSGWQVQAEDDPRVSDEPDLAGAESDAHGRFELSDLHPRPHRIHARPPEGGPFPAVEVSGVLPGPEELVLRVDPARAPSVTLSGRIVDEAGRPVDGARIALTRPGGGLARIFHPDPEGSFEIGPCPPGTWTLQVSSPELVECATRVLGPRALVPGEHWDCGMLVLGPGGRLLVELAPPALAAGLAPDFSVQREGAWSGVLRREGDAWRSGALDRGSYVLKVGGRGIAVQRVPFEIESGATTRLALALRPGIPLEIRARTSTRDEGTELRLCITDAQGATVLSGTMWLRQHEDGLVHPGDFGTEVALAPGAYLVEVGFAHESRRAKLVLAAEAERAEPLVFDLR